MNGILWEVDVQSLSRTLKFEKNLTHLVISSTLSQIFQKWMVCMSNNKTVWSSDQGDLRKKKDIIPSPSPSGRGGYSLPPGQQTAYLHRDSNGRGWKSVTLI